MPLYSPSKNAFFESSQIALINDAVEISEEQRQKLILGQSETKYIVPNEDGFPVLVERPPIPISEYIERKRKSIIAEYESACAIFKARYPRTEIEGWSEQVRALDAYDINPESENLLIDILAQHNNKTRAEMAENIRHARDRFINAYAQLTGLRQKLENDLDNISLDNTNVLTKISLINEKQLMTLAQQLQQS